MENNRSKTELAITELYAAWLMRRMADFYAIDDYDEALELAREICDKLRSYCQLLDKANVGAETHKLWSVWVKNSSLRLETLKEGE